MNLASFFGAVRPYMKGGILTQAQVVGCETIILECFEQDITIEHTAYILATAYHETGGRMEAVREGFAKTDAGARKAVADLFARKIISWDYAQPESNGRSYYGRGLVQLTHLDNYAKTGHALGLDLVSNPDQMLDLKTSVKAMIWGMTTGAYRKKKSLATELPFTDPTLQEWTLARDIINGDTRKNGERIARYAQFFYSALQGAV